MQGQLKINCVDSIDDNMLKTKRIGSFKCSYVVLISRILDYFGVDTKEEVLGFVEAKSEVKTKILKKTRYIKSNEEDGLGWIQKSKEDQIEQENAKEKPVSPLE